MRITYHDDEKGMHEIMSGNYELEASDHKS